MTKQGLFSAACLPPEISGVKTPDQTILHVGLKSQAPKQLRHLASGEQFICEILRNPPFRSFTKEWGTHRKSKSIHVAIMLLNGIIWLRVITGRTNTEAFATRQISTSHLGGPCFGICSIHMRDYRNHPIHKMGLERLNPRRVVRNTDDKHRSGTKSKLVQPADVAKASSA